MTVPELITRYSRPGLVSAVLVLSLVAVASRDRAAAFGRALSTVVAAVAMPVQSAFNAASQTAVNVVNIEPDEQTVRMENAMLRRRIAELGAIAVRSRELEAENERLRRLLAFRDAVQFDAVPARVIGRDYSYLSIDRGADSMICQQMCVLTSEGVVGRVLNVSGHTSKVLLIWDSNSRVGGIVQRSRAQGIVEGDQDGRCVMKYLEASVDVRPGDLVVTSGEGGVFPKGLAVGKVVFVERREGELFQRATVEPSADLGRLEEVLIAVAQTARQSTADTATASLEAARD